MPRTGDPIDALGAISVLAQPPIRTWDTGESHPVGAAGQRTVRSCQELRIRGITAK
jgi:hypothetical protein